jgi:hypothetical protein
MRDGYGHDRSEHVLALCGRATECVIFQADRKRQENMSARNIKPWLPESPEPAASTLVRGLMLVTAAGLILAFPGSTLAQQGTCVPSNTPHVSDGQRTYRINKSSLADLNGISQTQAIYAITMGAETWNEQANAGTFVRGYNTSLENLEATEEACNNAGQNYSLIVVKEDADGTANHGQAFGRCRNGDGIATQFQIELYVKNKNGDTNTWSSGDVTWPEIDMVGLLAHEFGHTLNLGHPQYGEAAVMNFARGTTRYRDLYAWDLKCAQEYSGHRNLAAYRRFHLSDGTLSGPWNFTGDWTVSQASAGVTWHTGNWDRAAAFKGGCWSWTRELNRSNSPCLPQIDDRVGIGPTEATWREDESVDRVFYSTWSESPSWQTDAKHQARYERSSDGFVNSTRASMSFCSTMSDWMECSNSQPLYTGKQMAFAWDNWSARNRTVSAWARQTRLDDSEDRELLISIGYIHHWRLPEPDSLGVQTSIPPAVACDYFSAGNYDCVVAFTEQSDSLHRLKTRRFYTQEGLNRYRITEQSLDPNIHTVANGVVRTVSPVALWFKEGYFWLLYRGIGPNNPMDLYRSSNGADWIHVQALSDSGLGLSAASYFQHADFVVYAR